MPNGLKPIPPGSEFDRKLISIFTLIRIKNEKENS
jgi:hypothetical protein